MTGRSGRIRRLFVLASRGAALIAAALLGAGASVPARAQVPEASGDTTAAVSVDTAAAPVRSVGTRAFVGGTLGSAIGLGGGAVTGAILAERACRTSYRDEYFCGLGEILLGMAVGSVVGSAVGAYQGAVTAGHEPSIGATVTGAVLGLGAGIALGALLGVTDNAGIVVIGFTIGQGAVAGRFASRSRPAPRESEEAPRESGEAARELEEAARGSEGAPRESGDAAPGRRAT